MKLNICVDIDGTITGAYDWLELANSYFNKNVKPHEVTRYEINEVLNISNDEYLEFYLRYGKELHAAASVRQHARDVLQRLNNEHSIYYVTARDKTMEQVTKKWFMEKDLPKGQLYLLGSHHKVQQAKELDCHIFIEDRHENALELARAGFQVLLMDCNYNRLPLINGITRVSCWQNIYEAIDNRAKAMREADSKIA